MADVTKQGRQ